MFLLLSIFGCKDKYEDDILGSPKMDIVSKDKLPKWINADERIETSVPFLVQKGKWGKRTVYIIDMCEYKYNYSSEIYYENGEHILFNNQSDYDDFHKATYKSLVVIYLFPEGFWKFL